MNKTFDRFLVLLGMMAVLIVIMAVVAMATRQIGLVAAESAGARATAGPAVTTAHLELSEWGIEGDLTVPPGPVRLEIQHRIGHPQPRDRRGGHISRPHIRAVRHLGRR